MSPQTTLEQGVIEVQEFEDSADLVTREEISVQRGPRLRRYASYGSVTWLPKALQQIKAISELHSGWDSQGGDPPDRSTLKGGAILLRLLASDDANIMKPHIHPTRSGGVQFHWEYGSRYFEIEVLDEKTAHFYFIDSNSLREYEGELHLGDRLTDVLRLLRDVRQG